MDYFSAQQLFFYGAMFGVGLVFVAKLLKNY